MYDLSLFIFRRDLRLADNRGLIKAAEQSKKIIPLFIIDPRQASTQNYYKSEHAFSFMLQSLIDLDHQLAAVNGKLYSVQGEPHTIVKALCATLNIQAVFTNRDYTPFSISRDQEIEKACHQSNCTFIQTDDALLLTPEQGTKADGSPYHVFTPFYRNAQKKLSIATQPLNNVHFYTKPIAICCSINKLYQQNDYNQHATSDLAGGREAAKKCLHALPHVHAYQKERDIPALDATSHLSAHLKFGTLSIREAFLSIHKTLGGNHPLLRQLFWRDFFSHIAFFYPHVFGHAFNKKYETLTWENDQKKFERWCEGQTGFPIVDAGMRELNARGFINGRIRMIVASFLIKDLHIDWRKGEHYFATKLVDYDPCVNNGNWQWVASTGCDAQPYFRIFNPWQQQKKFDPECAYIYRWVPELRGVHDKLLHTLYKKALPATHVYPHPLIMHDNERVKTIAYYKKAKLTT